MPASIGKTIAAALWGAAALSLTAPAGAAGVSIRSLAAQEARLAQIGYRIGTAGASMCTSRTMMTGLVVHDLTRYDAAARPAISRAFSLTSGIGILEVIPGSAAARAGLRTDDEILRVGSHDVRSAAAFDGRPKSSARMDRFVTLLHEALQSGPKDVLIRRQGALQSIRLSGQQGCGGTLSLANSSELNAWSDGTNVVLTTEMVSLAGSDDEIAFVIAHEMAHNILGHSRPSKARNGFFGSIARARRSEIEADSFAVRLASQAGYHPKGGITFLQAVSRRRWWAVSLDHPGFGRRIQAVADAITALPHQLGSPAALPASPPAVLSAVQPPIVAPALRSAPLTAASAAADGQQAFHYIAALAKAGDGSRVCER